MSDADQSTVEYRLVEGHADYRVGTDGSVWTKRRRADWKRLRPGTGKKGHRYVTFADRKSRYVHRLVLEAFVGPCPPGMECCHYPDPNPSNNTLPNLRWDTQFNNVQDTVRLGRSLKGERANGAKLTDDAIREIRAEFANGVLQEVLAKRFEVGQPRISMIVNRKIWKHVV